MEVIKKCEKSNGILWSEHQEIIFAHLKQIRKFQQE